MDRIVVKEDIEARLADSIETALNLSGGQLLVDIMGQEERGSAPTLLARSAASAWKN